MLRKVTMILAAAGLLGASAIPTTALAFGHGGGGGHFGGGFHGGFGGGGFSRGFAGHGFVGRGFSPGFYGHRHAGFGWPAVGLGLGLGYGAYSYYGNPCYALTPYGYQWVCDAPY
jgi:hypothetical protein